MQGLGSRLGLALVAAALGGCFPDYSVSEDGGNGAVDNNEVTVAEFNEWFVSGPQGPDLPGPGESLDPNGQYAAQMIWHAEWDADAKEEHFYVDHAEETKRCERGPFPATEMESTWERVAAGGNADGSWPMTCVSWAQAVAYCAWRGMRVPTTSEWMALRATATEGFPWGSEPPLSCGQAIVNIPGGPVGCGFPVSVDHPTDDLIAGHKNMIGSVFEWTWDAIWSSGGPPGQGESGPPNVTDLSVPRYRVSGAFVSDPGSPQVAGAFDPDHAADQVFNDLGFRCWPRGL